MPIDPAFLHHVTYLVARHRLRLRLGQGRFKFTDDAALLNSSIGSLDRQQRLKRHLRGLSKVIHGSPAC